MNCQVNIRRGKVEIEHELSSTTTELAERVSNGDAAHNAAIQQIFAPNSGASGCGCRSHDQRIIEAPPGFSKS